MSKLPDFLVIGAMKCGTTSLHHYLDMHPDIFMSEVKEIDFFTTNYHLGLDWYKRQFPNEKKLSGESSQNYSKRHHPDFKDAAERIHDVLPHVKIIYVVRDPVKRVISHIQENIESHVYQQTFDFNRYIMETPGNHWELCSMYYYQIEPYLRLFDRENIYLLSLEELQKNTSLTLNRIFAFLGLERLTDYTEFKIHNSAGDKYRLSKLSQWFAHNSRLRNGLKKMGGSLLEHFKSTDFYKYRIAKRKVNPPVLQEETIKILRERLSADYEKFSLLMKRESNSFD